MSPTSYQTAPPRSIKSILNLPSNTVKVYLEERINRSMSL
jgi:hypothetical protein